MARSRYRRNRRRYRKNPAEERNALFLIVALGVTYYLYRAVNTPSAA